MGGGECDVVRLWGGIKLPLVGFGTATFPYNGERISQAIGIALEVRVFVFHGTRIITEVSQELELCR